MALFPSGQSKIDVSAEVNQLRTQGLTDQQIMGELKSKGVNESQAISALGSLNQQSQQSMPGQPTMGSSSMVQQPAMMSSGEQDYMGGMPPQGGSVMSSPDNLYERVEEIAEGLIDEKWDDLIVEVKKIIEWKEKFEEKSIKINSDLEKLKEDFKTLHQGVLGKVEEYDKRMQDVGTELKAVGKVFKDVVPIFTDNVKELRHITNFTREEKENQKK